MERRRQIEVAGVATAVREGGRGAPLILLHGGIESGGMYWEPVVEQLARDHRLVIPDVPGLGESAPVPRLDAEAFERWLEALIGLTCRELPTVVAHSLIGTMAARLATKRSDLFGGLVVYAAPGVGPYRMPVRLRAVAIRFALRPTQANSERFERFALQDRERTRGLNPAWFDRFSAYTTTQARVGHVKRTMNRMIRTETRQIPGAALRRIAVPTALLWGSGDRMVPLSIAERARSAFGWPLHVVDHAAHVPHIEQPEAFVARLRDSITRPKPRDLGYPEEAVR